MNTYAWFCSVVILYACKCVDLLPPSALPTNDKYLRSCLCSYVNFCFFDLDSVRIVIPLFPHDQNYDFCIQNVKFDKSQKLCFCSFYYYGTRKKNQLYWSVAFFLKYLNKSNIK